MSVLKGYISTIAYHIHTLEAMAFGRKEGLEKVNDLLNPIIDHLTKIAIYNHSKDRTENAKHWQNEILGWLEYLDEFCNNLKDGKRLKLKDYMLCLGDDLGRDSIVKRKVNKISRKYEGLCHKIDDPAELREILWNILEAQFKAMSGEEWDKNTLIQNRLYKLLYDNKYFG